MQDLTDIGMQASGHNEWCDDEFVVNRQKLGWSLVWGLDGYMPVAVVETDEPWYKQSKLGLLLALTRRGWIVVNDKPPEWFAAGVTSGGPQELWAGMLRKSKWYYVAMLEAPTLWDKGIDKTEHSTSEFD